MSYRDLFAVFYAIFFASVLSSCGNLRFFQWGAFLQPRSRHKIRRLVLSLLLLNILPALCFALVYSKLPIEQAVGFLRILGIFFMALSVFGFYRIYHLLLSFRTIREYLYERKEEEDKESKESNDLKRRLDMIGKWQGQTLSIFFYFGLAMLSWWLIVR